MDQLLSYKSIPLGSLITVSDEEIDKYVAEVVAMPLSLQSLIAATRTGAYLRGVLRTYDVPLEKASNLALLILNIFLGEHPLNQLSALLVKQFAIPNDIAQKMSLDIEKELFAPVALEFNQYLKNRVQMQKQPTTDALHNLLDLKKQTGQPPLPPPLP